MKIKILILTHNYIRFSGDFAGVFLHNLSRNLVAEGRKIFILAPHQKGISKHQRIDGVEIYRFRYAPDNYERIAYAGNMHELVARNPINSLIFLFFLFFYFLKAYKVSKKFDIKIIHAHWWVPSGMVGWLVSCLLHKPLLITMHGTDLRIITNSRLSSFLAGIVFRRARYITVVSNFLKEKLLSELDLPEEKVLVIPMPVNTEKIRAFPVERGKSGKIILCVARYTRQKKLDVLLDGLSLLKDWKMDFEALLIGGGPEKDELVKRIKALSLEEKIKLVELISQEELNKYYNLSDVVVLPSVDEGFGLVLVEAGLCKKPVIGARSGGITDIIEDGVTGFLVPPEDKLALAEAIRKILSDDELAARLGQNAYEQVWKRFSPQAITERFLTIYEKILPERK